MNQKNIFGLLILFSSAHTFSAMEQENQPSPKSGDESRIIRRGIGHNSIVTSDQAAQIQSSPKKEAKSPATTRKTDRFSFFAKHKKQSSVSNSNNHSQHLVTQSESSFAMESVKTGNLKLVLNKKEPSNLTAFTNLHGFTAEIHEGNTIKTVQEILIDMLLAEAAQNTSNTELDKTIALLDHYLLDKEHFAKWEHMKIGNTPIIKALLAKFPESNSNNAVTAIKSMLGFYNRTSYTEDEIKAEQELLKKQDGGTDVDKGLRKNQDLSRQRSQTLKEKKKQSIE
ncbi:MAG: hypothetical protein WCE21_01160 [Candidatus Babeliales bacterium]